MTLTWPERDIMLGFLVLNREIGLSSRLKVKSLVVILKA